MKVKSDITDEWKEYEIEFGEENWLGCIKIVDKSGELTEDLQCETGCVISEIYGVVDLCESWQCLIAVSDAEWLDKSCGENEFAFEAEYNLSEILQMTDGLVVNVDNEWNALRS